MDILFVLIALGLAAWFWSDSTRARELAIKTATRHCQQMNVQLLDQTVSLHKLKLARNHRGRINFKRIYQFEFCLTGNARYLGYITLVAHQLQHIELDHPDGKILH